jgi:hypothetical protein
LPGLSLESFSAGKSRQRKPKSQIIVFQRRGRPKLAGAIADAEWQICHLFASAFSA